MRWKIKSIKFLFFFFNLIFYPQCNQTCRFSLQRRKKIVLNFTAWIAKKKIKKKILFKSNQKYQKSLIYFVLHICELCVTFKNKLISFKKVRSTSIEVNLIYQLVNPNNNAWNPSKSQFKRIAQHSVQCKVLIKMKIRVWE